MRPLASHLAATILAGSLFVACSPTPADGADVRSGATDTAEDDAAPTDAGPADTSAEALDTDEVPADASDDTYEAGIDAGDTWPPDVREFPPFVTGPPPQLFDCRARGTKPARRSPVPNDCVVDPACDREMVVAHRGAGGDFGVIAPENSLAAIRAAIVMGVEGVELDVRHTADETVVLMHDETVDRTTTGSGTVSKMTADEVTGLHLKPPDPEAFGDFSCSTVPTLVEALSLADGRLFVDIDMKTGRVDLVVDAIRRAGVVDRAFIGTSSLAKAERARDLEPNIHLQIRSGSRPQLDQALRRLERPPEIVEIPIDSIEQLAGPIHANDAKLFTNAFQRDAKAASDPDADPYTELYTKGADILQTEFPPLVVEKLGR